MKDILSTLNTLRRPPLLIRAARLGVSEYRRDVHLRRHLGPGQLPRCAAALERLIEIESDLDRARQERAVDYSAARHVDVLIAMMSEARFLRAALEMPAG
ncbi:MAG: hypothetical protein COW54_04235 [Rhodobacteraceae bacterium CG17_big_fil_post_rev_8_21_14_2_50_63_15]|nr:hypothetical protein [Roseovarius sp.]PIV79442.1 MAG: hypothetical protein COW54_04235 [Rhodobacteraceae bacterium CG17_big_fil_post_rev_8_21_14_2_50_63_15]